VRKFLPLLLPLLALAARADTLRLTAEDAVRLALADNRQIALAQAKLDEAAAGRGAAFGSFLPQISASGTYTRLGTVNQFYMPTYGRFPLGVYDPATGEVVGYTDSVSMAIGLDTLSLGSADNFIIRGTAQQTLFTWGKLVNAYRIAGLAADIQRYALTAAREQVRTDAISGFYAALLARRSAGLMLESEAQLERHVNRVRALYESGLAPSLDVMRATVGLTNLRAQRSSVQNGAELAAAALRMTLGLEPDVPLDLADDLVTEPVTIGLEPAIADALRLRPELHQLRAALVIADRSVAIARTANLPTAFAQFNYDYKNPVGFSSGWGTDWNATVGLSLPIFTGGANCNKLRQAEARRRQAEASLLQVEEAVRLEVQSLFAALDRERRNIEYAAESRALAESALALADQRYQNGLLTNLEYLDTQLALTQSRLAHETALANYEIARARLLRAIGASGAGQEEE
jgi:outer membrane protein TolC